MDGTGWGAPMTAVAAAVPLGLLAVLVVGRRWPLTHAAWVCAALTLGLALTLGGLDLQGVLVAIGKGLWTGTWILLIVVPALLLFQLADRGGAIQHLSEQLGGLAGTPARRLLLFAWVLPSFVQGVAGFGVPVVIAAPMLVRAGMVPAAAVAAVLVGYHWSVTFGSMGSSFLVAVGTSGVDGATAGRFALYASVLLAVNAVVGAMLLLRRAEGGVRDAVLPMIVTATAMGATLVLAVSVEPALGSTTAGLVGMVTLVMLLQRRGRKVDGGQLALAAAPYVALTAMVLVGMGVPPVRELADRVPPVAPSFPATQSALTTNEAVVAHQPLALLGHPALYLVVACFGTWLLYRRIGWLKRDDARPVLSQWGVRARGTIQSLLGLTVLAAMMVESGLIAVLADGIVAALGQVFLPIAPVVGALGTALTGSTTASNALLAPLQAASADGLGVDPALLLTAQTVGGNVGNVFTPINVAVAAAAVDATGRESEILRDAGRDGAWLLMGAAAAMVLLVVLV